MTTVIIITVVKVVVVITMLPSHDELGYMQVCNSSQQAKGMNVQVAEQSYRVMQSAVDTARDTVLM